jgi:hypothetical protein
MKLLIIHGISNNYSQFIIVFCLPSTKLDLFLSHCLSYSPPPFNGGGGEGGMRNEHLLNGYLCYTSGHHHHQLSLLRGCALLGITSIVCFNQPKPYFS